MSCVHLVCIVGMFSSGTTSLVFMMQDALRVFVKIAPTVCFLLLLFLSVTCHILYIYISGCDFVVDEIPPR